ETGQTKSRSFVSQARGANHRKKLLQRILGQTRSDKGSPSMITFVNLRTNPILTASRHARASSAKADPTLSCTF
ncbi:hypothetical protein Golax_010377, partial [Gossypium laxum]|nr:hypothetical protein [Gossypium laxum]